MEYLKYSLAAGEYVNRFLFSGVCSEPSPYRPTVLQGKVNEWLMKGWSIYDNPCRKEMAASRQGTVPPMVDLTAMLPGEELMILGQSTQTELYFPFDSEGFLHSAFYRTPANLRGYLGVVIEAPEKEDAVFELCVSGSAALWLNGVLCADFAPLMRNVERSTHITLPLQKGDNRLTVCLEDFAERDTDLRLRLRYLGRQPLAQCVPVRPGVSADRVQAAEDTLSQMRFTRDVYIAQPVVLQLSSAMPEPVGINIRSNGDMPPVQMIIDPGQHDITLFDSSDYASAFYHFRVSMMVDGLVLHKIIGTYANNGKWSDCGGDTYAERRAIVREIIRTANVHHDYRAIVQLEDGADAAPLEEIFYDHLLWVEEKRDCSDFRLMVLVCLYARYADRLTEAFRTRLEQAMLNYRYWIDEPGDDVMWFFSENHALMFHTCQYLAGLAMPERIFTASGLTGREAANKAERLLNSWFDAFLKEGSTEWNSSTYIPIDFMALGYLHLLTPCDAAIHRRAQQALDLLCCNLALCEHHGVVMTSFGRTYEKEMKGSLSTGMTSLLYLFYHAGYMNEHTRALVPFVIGDYEPPMAYQRYTGLQGNRQLIFENTQGLDRFVNLYLYKNAKALLSTAVCFHPFEHGYQENIVQATIDAGAQVFVNHPGEREVYGSGRPGFWAGNGVLPRAFQYRSISLVEYRIPSDQPINYTHAYVPLNEFSVWRISEHAVALEKDGAYIGLRTLNSLALQQQGPCAYREIISHGRSNLWIIKVGRAGEFTSVDELLAQMDAITISVRSGDHIAVQCGADAYRIEHDTFTVNGLPVHQYPLSVRGIVEEKDL